MTDVKGEFRYTSKLIAVPIITIFLSMFLILSVPEKVKLLFIFSFFLSFLFTWLIQDTHGNFEANETEVKFVTLGKKIVIEFKDIKKIELKNILKCEVGGLYYYNICLKIITSDNIYKYSSKFEPRFGGVKDLPLAFTERYNNNDFVLLYNYINERVSNKADEKPTE